MPARPNIWFSLLIGVSCVLIGFALSTMAYRYRYLRVPGGGLIERMNLELNLTPAQRDQIGDILRDTRFKVEKERRDFDHKRHQLFWEGLAQIRSALTPDQQKIFDRDFTRLSMHGGHDDGGGDHDHGPPDESSSPAAPSP